MPIPVAGRKIWYEDGAVNAIAPSFVYKKFVYPSGIIKKLKKGKLYYIKVTGERH